MNMYACIINIQVPHEVNNQHALAIKDDFQNNEKLTRCNYPNGKFIQA